MGVELDGTKIDKLLILRYVEEAARHLLLITKHNNCTKFYFEQDISMIKTASTMINDVTLLKLAAMENDDADDLVRELKTRLNEPNRAEARSDDALKYFKAISVLLESIIRNKQEFFGSDENNQHVTEQSPNEKSRLLEVPKDKND